jgi:hypothetical protein
MTKKNFLGLFLLSFFLLCGSLNVQAQTTQAETKNDETNLDTQLYLVVGTNQDVVDSKLPAALDPVLKELRATLPFKNYRLAATLINRVKNEGHLDLSWIGAPLALNNSSSSVTMPSFSQFRIRQVKLARGSDGQQVVQMDAFNFGTRVPIQVSGAIAANGAIAPTINYESTGVATDISMHEGEPVIVGTLNIGPSGDAIILVVSAKRTQR